MGPSVDFGYGKERWYLGVLRLVYMVCWLDPLCTPRRRGAAIFGGSFALEGLQLILQIWQFVFYVPLVLAFFTNCTKFDELSSLITINVLVPDLIVVDVDGICS